MTSIEAYYKFLQKINRNATQGNITCDVYQFVTIYNEVQKRWLSRQIPESTSDDVNNVQSIITPAVISPKSSKKEFSEYDLPNNWFDSANAYVVAKKGKCEQNINLEQIKSSKTREYLFDDSYQPSFEHEWSFFTIESNKIKVFKTDFELKKLYFYYYKEPFEIDIEGYQKIDGSLSQNVNPDLADIFVDQIISEATTEFMRNYQNPIGLQISKDRQISENN